jgi:hypothetical protein
MSIEAMKQALEALEWNLPVIEDYGDKEQLNRQHRAITALRTAIEATEKQEPVAFIAPNGDLRKTTEAKDHWEWGAEFTSLYTTPPAAQRQWVGLTDEEITESWSWAQSREAEHHASTGQHAFAYAIEAKLKEKNT